MDRDASWEVIAGQRTALADLLDGLAPEQWEAPSLCEGWRVRDVAAHVALTPQHPGPGAMLVGAVRARGDFDRLNRDLALAHAERGPDRLVAELRAHAANRRLPVVTTYRNLLFDVLVHVQDVAIPLGVEQPMPVAAAREGVQRVWSMGWPFHARRRLGGMRLVATDSDWTAGDGPEVHGTTGALLLLLTGRTAAALPRLAGPGCRAL
ncbi:maleylpyruvate isomerase family mycothiol-dependent enzyme [Pseudonocardia hydrocarbonoxydans]|uniref:Mycothiol-dependent maleylpyruvate isomerase metal-binding domain-containing protein n=1 Tax=Pseudonocardia hydrocarbonoxydans TaxID=76726 RepID=A0A4Y3WLH5_9PSEU|nr:maleylpyruvate isomerase family mycothiol-dependent enzyme [Pseudonocardia hydrocarbonoxydans]GEC19358.1 hypothetical protein PHY01_16410 [Pseudonocardia hydrocarbonoxydans]